ncbi:hypothetical protein [Stutzerimonas stutzeri]|uniref:hypothetical protein n=1 Tax=Stutzerimonas stutzeri TaxID=316 RepID=UPI0015E28AF9|nr:hypothetical protein [Stutzerimonas stutzeri]MBA1280298.1 hypothetical protein [Stutzerimonas stutzeri]
MSNRNATFLTDVDGGTRAAILEAIAKYYGITPEEAFDEVADEQAEHLLDYMVEPMRSATWVLMQRRGVSA